MLKNGSTNYGRNKHYVKELNAEGVPQVFSISVISMC